jgi:hypothetical protein
VEESVMSDRAMTNWLLFAILLAILPAAAAFHLAILYCVFLVGLLAFVAIAFLWEQLNPNSLTNIVARANRKLSQEWLDRQRNMTYEEALYRGYWSALAGIDWDAKNWCKFIARRWPDKADDAKALLSCGRDELRRRGPPHWYGT